MNYGVGDDSAIGIILFNESVSHCVSTLNKSQQYDQQAGIYLFTASLLNISIGHWATMNKINSLDM